MPKICYYIAGGIAIISFLGGLWTGLSGRDSDLQARLDDAISNNQELKRINDSLEGINRIQGDTIDDLKGRVQDSVGIVERIRSERDIFERELEQIKKRYNTAIGILESGQAGLGEIADGLQQDITDVDAILDRLNTAEAIIAGYIDSVP